MENNKRISGIKTMHNYLTDDGHVDEKAKNTKKCVMKRDLENLNSKTTKRTSSIIR